MATLLALYGNEGLSAAIKAGKGPWLEFPWRAALEEVLIGYFDWDFSSEVEKLAGRCPSCRRRMDLQQTEDGARLWVEHRAGSRG